MDWNSLMPLLGRHPIPNQRNESWITFDKGGTVGDAEGADALYLLSTFDNSSLLNYNAGSQSFPGAESIWAESIEHHPKPGEESQSTAADLLKPTMNLVNSQIFDTLEPSSSLPEATNGDKRRWVHSQDDNTANANKRAKMRRNVSRLSNPAAYQCIQYVARKFKVPIPMELETTENGDLECHPDFSVLEEFIKSGGLTRKRTVRKRKILPRDAELIRKYRKFQPWTRRGLKVHSGPYRCTFGCPWNSDEKGDWIKHEKSHYPAEIWRCRHKSCKQAMGKKGVYVQKYGLRDHLKKKHNEQPDNQSLEHHRLEITGSLFPDHCCIPNCKIRFPSMEARLEHLSTEHDRDSIAEMLQIHFEEQNQEIGNNPKDEEEADTDERSESRSESDESDFHIDHDGLSDSYDDDDGDDGRDDPGASPNGYSSNSSHPPSDNQDMSDSGSKNDYGQLDTGSGPTPSTYSNGYTSYSFGVKLCHANPTFCMRNAPITTLAQAQVRSTGVFKRVVPGDVQSFTDRQHFPEMASVKSLPFEGNQPLHIFSHKPKTVEEKQLTNSVSSITHRESECPSQRATQGETSLNRSNEGLSSSNDAELAYITSSLSQAALSNSSSTLSDISGLKPETAKDPAEGKSISALENKKTSSNNMSELEPRALISCTANLIRAFDCGIRIVQQIKERRKAHDALPPPALLEEFLETGKREIENVLEEGQRRFGPSFVEGDMTAKLAILHITLQVQNALLERLLEAREDNGVVDFNTVIDLSDKGRNDALLQLRQLYSRRLEEEIERKS